MKNGKAFLAGVVGGAVMSIIMAIARAVGMGVNLEMMLGTMFGLLPGPTVWLLGLVVHLVISGLIALLYAVGFEQVLHRGGWQSGLLLSLVHILIGGLVMGAVPAVHPLVPEQMMGPGPFMANLGAIGVLAFIMLHMIYGAIVGGMYGPAIHTRPRQRHSYT